MPTANDIFRRPLNQTSPGVAPNMSTPNGSVYSPPPTSVRPNPPAPAYTPTPPKPAPSPMNGAPWNVAANSGGTASVASVPAPTSAAPQKNQVTMTGSMVPVTKNGQTRMIDSAFLPSFLSAGFTQGATSPVATQPQAAAPANANQNIYSLYGMEAQQQPNADIFSMYGVDQPSLEAPNTASIDAEIANLRPNTNTNEVQQMLDMQLADIASRYNIERSNIEKGTANEFQSSLSGLYNTGVVNPLSSGTGSIDAANDRILDERMQALSSAEQAEVSQARARAFDLKTRAQDKALDFALSERDRVEKKAMQNYEYERQQMSDKLDMVNNVVNAWRVGQTIQKEKREEARGNVLDVISNFGSAAFEGMDEKVIGDLETATGYPAGSLIKGITALKQKELIKPEEEMLLRTIGGSLYNITRNDDGTVKADLIISGKSGGTGGSGGGRGGGSSEGKTFEEWLNEKEDQDQMTYNLGDKSVLNTLQSMYEQQIGNTTKGAVVKFTPTQKLKLEQAGLLYAPRQEQLDFLYKKNSSSTDSGTEDDGVDSAFEAEALKALGIEE